MLVQHPVICRDVVAPVLSPFVMSYFVSFHFLASTVVFFMFSSVLASIICLSPFTSNCNAYAGILCAQPLKVCSRKRRYAPLYISVPLVIATLGLSPNSEMRKSELTNNSEPSRVTSTCISLARAPARVTYESQDPKHIPLPPKTGAVAC